MYIFRTEYEKQKKMEEVKLKIDTPENSESSDVSRDEN